MMCPDQAFEDHYFAMLNLVDTYKVTKNMLELKMTAQGITLKYNVDTRVEGNQN